MLNGEKSLDFETKPGEASITKETEVSVGVRESPGISGETSIFRVVIRLEALCD